MKNRERTIIGVHGFNFDPASDARDPFRLFHMWGEMLQTPVVGFPWYSSVPTLGGILGAWTRCYRTRYSYAYHALARDAAGRLANVIADAKRPVSIICHSLGSRVALRTLCKVAPGKVDRILILDGAELQTAAGGALKVVCERGEIVPKILNVCSRHDRVLRHLGSWASGKAGRCIGYAGLGSSAPGWTDLFLDDASTQKWALDRHEWALESANPLDLAGHWESYTLRGNWPLYRRFLTAAEDPFEGLPVVSFRD
jgi:pimeloyl-ACP methyl ester carboxylesterase